MKDVLCCYGGKFSCFPSRNIDWREYLTLAQRARNRTATNAWRKLKIQGKLFRRFPQQIQNLTKSIRKRSIERIEGKAWIFFIFAICDWLPPAYRGHSHDKQQQQKTLCKVTQQRPRNTYLPVQPNPTKNLSGSKLILYSRSGPFRTPH